MRKRLSCLAAVLVLTSAAVYADPTYSLVASGTYADLYVSNANAIPAPGLPGYSYYQVMLVAHEGMFLAGVSNDFQSPTGSFSQVHPWVEVSPGVFESKLTSFGDYNLNMNDGKGSPPNSSSYYADTQCMVTTTETASTGVVVLPLPSPIDTASQMTGHWGYATTVPGVIPPTTALAARIVIPDSQAFTYTGTAVMFSIGAGTYYNQRPNGSGGYLYDSNPSETFSNIGPRYVWDGQGSTNWSAATAWSPDGAPAGGASNLALVFGAVTAANTTSNNNLASPTQVRTITFENASGQSFNLTGGQIKLDGTGPAIVQNSSAAQAISNNILLNTNATVGGPGSGNLALSGAISGPGDLIKVGSGKVTLSNANSYAGKTIVDRGELRLAVGQTMNALEIRNDARLTNVLNGGSSGTSLVKSLTINTAGGAKLDLNDNDLVIDYTGANPIADVHAYITAGFNGWMWDGAGIASSAAQIEPTGMSAIGFLDNAEWGYTSFSGRTVDGTSILIKYTWYGDADLDGVITPTDYTMIDLGYAGAGSGWLYGDFDYDGAITATDYTLIDVAYAMGLPGLGSGLTAVPEPMTLSLLGLGAAVLLGKRRRSY